MTKEKMRAIGSVPMIADGNPSTLLAIERLANDAGLDFTTHRLQATSAFAQLFHQRMTSNPDRSKEYVDSSEKERAGWKGRAFGIAAATEFAVRCALVHDDTPLQWNVVQELPLRRLPSGAMRRLGIHEARLLTPDVYPKESGIDAVLYHDKKLAHASVWNRDAYEELSDRQVPVVLHRPYLLEGLRPMNETFMDEGVSVVVKVSGSGAPKDWVFRLRDTLNAIDEPYALHSPSGRVVGGLATLPRAESFEERIEQFYNDLGGQTRLVVGYPSELVGVVCELRERGVPVWMLALPPRGAHELRNLEFALRHGIVFAELDMTGLTRESSLPGLQLMPLHQLQKALITPPPSLSKDLIGSRKLFQ